MRCEAAAEHPCSPPLPPQSLFERGCCFRPYLYFNAASKPGAFTSRRERERARQDRKMERYVAEGEMGSPQHPLSGQGSSVWRVGGAGGPSPGAAGGAGMKGNCRAGQRLLMQPGLSIAPEHGPGLWVTDPPHPHPGAAQGWLPPAGGLGAHAKGCGGAGPWQSRSSTAPWGPKVTPLHLASAVGIQGRSRSHLALNINGSACERAAGVQRAHPGT